MQRFLEQELSPGERIVWSQQPRPFARVCKSILECFWSVPFFAFGAFLVGITSAGLMPSESIGTQFFCLFLTLFGGGFLVVGFFGMLSPLSEYWKALRTIYAITDQRAIFIESPLRYRIYSFAGEHLVDIHRIENKSGRGDIIFHREAQSKDKSRAYDYNVGFIDIERVREVEDYLRQLYVKKHGV